MNDLIGETMTDPALCGTDDDVTIASLEILERRDER